MSSASLMFVWVHSVAPSVPPVQSGSRCFNHEFISVEGFIRDRVGSLERD